MIRSALKRLSILAAVAALSACGLDKQEAPPLTGPSTFGLSVKMTASPDHLVQNGSSQSVITMLARDAANQPINGLSLHVEMFADGVQADFGTLSSRLVSTGSDGRATVAFLAPPPDPPGAESDHVVTVVVTPVGTDFGNDTPHAVSLMLMRPGVILPPNGTPVPNFFFSPTGPHEGENVQFDASSSTDDGQIVSYTWSFGDGSTGSGVRPVHAYGVAGTYQVILTVKDDRGLSASTSPKSIGVVAASTPTATFTISPTNPTVGNQIFFNASGSTVPTGRSIVSYEWDFGDGTTGSGQTTSHTFTKAQSVTITLVITDNLGFKATFTRTVSVNP